MSKLWTKRISRTLDATVSIEGREDSDQYTIKYIRLESEYRDIRVWLQLSDIEVNRLVQLISEAGRGVVKFKDDD
jgi:hypothetical protein